MTKSIPKKRNVVDALFDTLKDKKKQKKAQEEKELEKENQEKKKKQQLKKIIEASEAKYKLNTTKSNPNPVLLRRDEDGWPIYAEDSLGMQKGGKSADCPFDCWCCF